MIRTRKPFKLFLRFLETVRKKSDCHILKLDHSPAPKACSSEAMQISQFTEEQLEEVNPMAYSWTLYDTMATLILEELYSGELRFRSETKGVFGTNRCSSILGLPEDLENLGYNGPSQAG